MERSQIRMIDGIPARPTGVIVGNGIYYMLISATLDPGGAYTTLPVGETYLRSAQIINIPVDILRIINLQATGITQTNPISKISYINW